MSPTMVEVLKAWYVFSFSLGCWTCLNLLVSRRGEPKIKYTMLAFVVLLLTPALNAYTTLVMHQPINWLFTLSHKLTWGYGPIVVVLIQYILLQKQRPLTFVLHALPFTFAALQGILNWQWVNPKFMIILLFIQVFCYLGYAGYLLKKNRNRILTLAVQHKNTTYYWLLYLVAGLVLLMLFDVCVYIGLYNNIYPSALLIGMVASIVALYANTIALFSVYQPDVFMHVLDKKDEAKEVINEVPEKQHLRSVELSAEVAQQLDEQLQKLVDSHKPHLDENISLAKLASLLGVTSHQLSELLNIHKATNFYDFLNDLRYQESLKILTNHSVELTIADIAYQSGFNNRNSFYTVFKEKTGVTPSQYKKSMR